MPTLILPPRYTPDSVALWKAAGRLGWAVERLQTWRVPFDLSDQDDVVLYGGLSFLIADELKVKLLEPPLDWLARVPYEYLHRRIEFTTLAAARSHSHRAFFKPADEKAFTAGVYESGPALPANHLLPALTPVLISEPVVWEVEFRCFVPEGEVTTLSPYLRFGQIAEGDDGQWRASDVELDQARAFATHFIRSSGVAIPPAVTMDVGLIAGKGWGIVELNPVWGSGIYGCDPEQVLQTIQRACVRQDTITDRDRPWILERDDLT